MSIWKYVYYYAYIILITLFLETGFSIIYINLNYYYINVYNTYKFFSSFFSTWLLNATFKYYRRWSYNSIEHHICVRKKNTPWLYLDVVAWRVVVTRWIDRIIRFRIEFIRAVYTRSNQLAVQGRSRRNQYLSVDESVRVRTNVTKTTSPLKFATLRKLCANLTRI